MPSCCAINCSNEQKAGSGKSFHLFPYSQPDVLKQWIVNIKRDKWQPNKKSVICSDHFEESCFDKTGQTVRLRKGSVPTRFQFPPHLQKAVKKRPSPRKRKGSDTKIQDEENCSATTVKPEQVHQEHHYHVSPHKVHAKLKEVSERYVKRQKLTQQCLRRLKHNVFSLKEVVTALREEKFLTTDACEVLQKSISGAPLELLLRTIKNKKSGDITREEYPTELRKFAVTLQFYSSKAYNYVRQTFNLALPHPATMRKWFSKINALPGFIEESFEAVSSKVSVAEQKGETLVFSLMMDEMSIMKHVEWDGKKYWGYVDVGVDNDSDDIPVAREALVIMLVCINAAWKIPVAYFLINGLSGEIRANIIIETIKRLYDIKARVVSLTCDGPQCNFRMIGALGASVDLSNPVTYFQHPSNVKEKVFIVFDACHMLKLIRNAWAQYKVFKSSEGEINWKYITALHELQEQEGLTAGNKLRSAHIHYHKQIMKVNLAAQTLSHSVADAIEWCRRDLGLRSFAGSEATVTFIRKIDQLFDILNSCNPFAKGFKAPLRASNSHIWQPFLRDVIKYLGELTMLNDVPLCNCPRKTAVVGFCVTALSTIGLFNELVGGENGVLQYLLTYKLSQDHLELFFSAVRARGGWNNNPTARQFMVSFRRLLVHHEVQTSGNITAQDKTNVLCLNGSHVSPDGKTRDIVDLAVLRKYDLLSRDPIPNDHDYSYLPDMEPVGEYAQNIITYIAGYVVRMVQRKISCVICLEALEGENDLVWGTLLQQKTNGGLIKPSKDVVEICQQSDTVFRRMLKASGNNVPHADNILFLLVSVVFEACASKNSIFQELANHFFDTSPGTENHIYRLIKVVSECYFRIRLFNLAKQKSTLCKGAPVRKLFSRLVIFRNQ